MRLLLFLLLFPLSVSAQFDTCQIVAIKLYNEMNRYKEYDSLSRIEITHLRSADSLSRLENESLRSAVKEQGTLIQQYSHESERWKRKAKRARRVVLLSAVIGLVVGVVVG